MAQTSQTSIASISILTIVSWKNQRTSYSWRERERERVIMVKPISSSVIVVALLVLGTACRKVESFRSSFQPRTASEILRRYHGSVLEVPSFQLVHNPIQQQALSSTARRMSDDGDVDGNPTIQQEKLDPVVQDAALLLRRLSWGSWWAQMILTTVSSVTLLFSKNVIQNSNPTASVAAAAASSTLPNFVLAGSGIIVSFVSIFWTWASKRLSRRLLKKFTSKIQAATMLRKAISIGVLLNVIGIFFAIMGAEQIVGVLAIKVLTARTGGLALDPSSAAMALQPLDILVVQANTNTLFSHFCSLVALLYMSRSILKLDPPSTEGGNVRSGNVKSEL